jgi:hypothetical protein
MAVLMRSLIRNHNRNGPTKAFRFTPESGMLLHITHKKGLAHERLADRKKDQ